MTGSWLDSKEPHQISLLSRVLDCIMDLTQNAVGDTRLAQMIASLPSTVNTTEDKHQNTSQSIPFIQHAK